MEPKIIRKDKFKLAGYAINTKSANCESVIDIPTFWQDYMSDGRMDKLHSQKFVKSHEEYGACLPMEANGNIKYLIGVETNGLPIPSDFFVYDVNSQTYAVFTTPKATNADFVSKIHETWNFIYNQWLPNSPYKMDKQGIDFELYDERCFGDDNKLIDIYIPIIER